MSSFDPTPRPALRPPAETGLRPAPDRGHHPALPREVPSPPDAPPGLSKDAKRSVTIKAKVPKSVRKQLKELAERQGISVGELIARMVAREPRG